MRHYVVRNFARAERSVIDRLGACGVATVHEAQGRYGLMKPFMRPIYPGAKMAGSAVTVLCHEGDNIMIHAAIETLKPGDVLVVTTKAECSDGMFGDLLAASTRAHGGLGLIIDAGIRDVYDLTEMKFPVWAKAVYAAGTVKESPGSVNVPIVAAGQVVRAGDIVLADDDGVCIVKRENAEEVAKLAEARIAKENVSRQELMAGKLGVEKFRTKLAEMGVKYADTLPEDWMS
jgi:4-hydroxy-4-methyl-2-oxoglutarate aldolase